MSNFTVLFTSHNSFLIIVGQKCIQKKKHTHRLHHIHLWNFSKKNLEIIQSADPESWRCAKPSPSIITRTLPTVTSRDHHTTFHLLRFMEKFWPRAFYWCSVNLCAVWAIFFFLLPNKQIKFKMLFIVMTREVSCWNSKLICISSFVMMVERVEHWKWDVICLNSAYKSVFFNMSGLFHLLHRAGNLFFPLPGTP